jgi:hypothetical protein
LSFIGCSKEGASTKPVKQPRLVPATVAELEASPDFKLDYTTKGGTKIYIRFIDPKVDESIADTPDWQFRDGSASKPYLVAVAYRGSVVSEDSLDTLLRTPDGAYTPEGEEYFIYAFKRMAKESAVELERMTGRHEVRHEKARRDTKSF